MKRTAIDLDVFGGPGTIHTGGRIDAYLQVPVIPGA